MKPKLILSKILLIVGSIVCSSPIILYLLIHDNFASYIWIINGPFPFSSFGSGPFQLYMFVGLFIVGVLLIAVSLILKEKIFRK